MPIVLSAYVGGLGAGLFATLLAALSTDYFIMPPVFSLRIARSLDLVQWLILILTGVLVSALCGALRRSETDRTRFAAIIKSSDDAIISKDLQGRITSWNHGAERIFGYSAAEILGQPIVILIPPARLDEETRILDRIRRGEEVDHFETVRLTKDGRLIDLSVSISPIFDAQGNIVGASKIARDITEQRRAQQAMRESDMRYHTLFETLIEGFCTIEMVYDPLGKPNDFRFIEANPAFETQSGLHNAQGRLLSELAPNLESYWVDIYGKVALTGESIHFENESKALGRCFDIYAYRVGGSDSRKVAILFNDVTARKAAETKATAQLARLALLQRITRAIGDRQDLPSIFRVVTETLEQELPVQFGCLCLYDPADETLTVASVGAASNALAVELGIPEHSRIPIDQNGLARCVSGQLVYEPEIDRVSFPFPQRLANGGLRSLVATPLQVESRVFGVLICARRERQAFSSGECEFLRQLSEHVALAAHQAETHLALQRAYDELRLSQQTALQQERLRALGQMASGIAHDINNALSPVALYTDTLLEREAQLSSQGREQLQVIQRAVEDVTQTVARLREFYRQRDNELPLLPVQLNKLVPQVVNLTRARWHDMPQQRGVVIQMQTDLTTDLAAFRGVEGEVREALTNLVFNAVDAMPEGGTLSLSTGTSAVDARVFVAVTDTGAGMDEEVRRRCMEPFFTTKGERGTGLGLAMVYGVVQRHGGQIEIDSAPGRGTTVRLLFTAHSGDGPAIGEAAAAAVIVPRQKMLLVDDDPLLLKSLRDTLQADGHEIRTANSGQEGIDAFAEALRAGQPFSIVITDLGMPHIDGRRVAEAIKKMSATTPVILLTGWGRRMVEEGDVPAHVDQVLSKPPKLRQLREALARSCR